MGFSIKSGKDPRNPYEAPRHPDVEVYFIGDFMYPIDPKTGKPDTSVDILIGADGRRPYKMPALGKSITVPAQVAKRLMRNAQMPYPQKHPQHGRAMRDALTLDKEFAELKAKAFKSGRPMEVVVAADNLSKLSDEELMAEIARRQGTPVYEDKKKKREDPSVDGEIVYMDETEEAQAEHAEEVVYQDESDGQVVGKGRGRPKKEDK